MLEFSEIIIIVTTMHVPSAEDALLFSPRVRGLPLREERALLSDALLEQRLHQVRAAAGVHQQLVVHMFDERIAAKAKNNLGKIDEIVFGRDADGSNKVMLPGASDPGRRVSSKAMMPREKMPYLEVGEVLSGTPSLTGTLPPPPASQLRASPGYPCFPSPASARRYGDASPRVMGSYGALQQGQPGDDAERAHFAAMLNLPADQRAGGADRAREATRMRSQRSNMPFGPSPASLGHPPLSAAEERCVFADLVDVRGKPLGLEGAHSPRKAECAAKGVRSQLPGFPLEQQGVAYEPPLPPPGYYLRPDELGVRARGPYAGRRSHSVLHEDRILTDAPRPCTPPKPPHPLDRFGSLSLEHGTSVMAAPAGSFVDADGSVRRPSGFPGRSARSVLTEAEGGWRWAPEAHHAASAARRAARAESKLLQEPHASAAQGSSLGDLVYGSEDPSTWDADYEATNPTRRPRGADVELLHYAEEAGTMPPRPRHGHGGPRHADTTHLRSAPTAYEQRETTALPPMHSLRRTTEMLRYHENGEPFEDGRIEAPPGGKRALPGPQPPDSARAVLHGLQGDGGARARAAGGGDWAREPVPTDIRGRAIPDGPLGGKVGAHAVYTRPRHLPREHAHNTAADYLGRAEATSNVDEAMYGKTPPGGQLRQVNLGADFNINRFGVASHNPLRYD